jgi:hypothetical protein
MNFLLPAAARWPLPAAARRQNWPGYCSWVCLEHFQCIKLPLNRCERELIA